MTFRHYGVALAVETKVLQRIAMKKKPAVISMPIHIGIVVVFNNRGKKPLSKRYMAQFAETLSSMAIPQIEQKLSASGRMPGYNN